MRCQVVKMWNMLLPFRIFIIRSYDYMSSISKGASFHEAPLVIVHLLVVICCDLLSLPSDHIIALNTMGYWWHAYITEMSTYDLVSISSDLIITYSNLDYGWLTCQNWGVNCDEGQNSTPRIFISIAYYYIILGVNFRKLYL